MQLGYFNYPLPVNEPVLSYAPGSPERKSLKEALAALKKKSLDIPMYINGKAVRTGKTQSIHPPHETKHVLGHFHIGTKVHVEKAIESALKVRENWSNMTWETRAHIFLKAADLLATKYRFEMNASTMLGQSKNS